MTSGELSADTDVGALVRPDRGAASWHRRLAALPPNYFAVAFGLAGLGLTWRPAATVAAVPGRVADLLFLSAASVVVGLGGWLTGQWVVTDLALDHVHPGYFLPTVAGGYVGAVLSFVLNWIAHTRPAWGEALSWLSLAAITAFVGVIAVLTVRAIVARTFFPHDERVVA